MTLDEQLKGRFTEEEARHIGNQYRIVYNVSHVDLFKQKGWIKTKLEEAREFYEENKSFSGVTREMFYELHKLYELAIEELREEK